MPNTIIPKNNEESIDLFKVYHVPSFVYKTALWLIAIDCRETLVCLLITPCPIDILKKAW